MLALAAYPYRCDRIGKHTGQNISRYLLKYSERGLKMQEKLTLCDNQAIKSEIYRLQELLKDAPKLKTKTAAGLIERCAHLRVLLEVLETDLNQNGLTELFSQSDKNQPYPRERCEARMYANLSKIYQSGMKQLLALLPANDPQEEDGFDALMNL